MHSDSWETKRRLNYITNAVTPLPSQSSHTHVAPSPNYYEPVSVMTPVTFPLGFLAMQV